MKSAKSSKKIINNSSLADSTDIFAFAFENSPIGKSITNVDGTLKVNNAFCQMIGYVNREEMDKRNFAEITYADDLDLSKKAIDDLIKNKSNKVCFEKRYLHKNGSIVWAEVFVVLHRDSQGNPLFFLTDIIDISERKHIEQQLQDTTEEVKIQNEEYIQINEELLQTNHELLRTKEIIEDSERNYRFLTENIIDVVWILDIETLKFNYVSPSVFKLRGYTAEEVLGQTIQESLTQQSVEKLNQILSARIEEFNTNPANSKIYYDEIEQPCKDGTTVLTETITYYHVNKKNGHMEVIGTSRNITERKQTELLLLGKNSEIEVQNEELQQLNEELSQINEELKEAEEKAVESDHLKTAFLQNMSHEIRTPMNAIMGFSELLASNYNDKEKLKKFSTIICHRCNDLLDIINDILDISKIESGQLSVNIEQFNLYVFFEELHTFFQEYQKRLGKQHIKLNLQASYYSSNFEILTDQGKLKQIFINLISNAFKFTESGKIEGGFKFDENYNLIFYLSDTGIGIPSEKQDAVFERFVQLNQDTKKLIGGTGLGLSIVKGLVSLLGGKIWLESQPGKGTTFFFTLPFKSTRPSQNKATLIEKPKDYHFSNKMILIVEDDFYNAEYLNEILDGTGFDIIETKYGKEAVKIAASQDLDIVLMDIRLPDIDGYEATQQIRKYKPNLKIIAQTAYASLDEKKKALDAGCNDYISKPIKKDLLLAMIGKQLMSIDY